MLNTIVSSLLVQYLDQYIANFDKKSVKLSIFNGDLRLKDLRLKAYALDNIDVNVPVVIEHGYLGSLTIKLPNLASLRKSAVVIDISNVFLVLKPKKAVVWNEEVEQKRIHDLKQQKLDQYELQRKILKDEEKKSTKNGNDEEKNSSSKDAKQKKLKKSGFVDKLLETIINNIQIRIRNVHLRYEDEMLSPGNPIVLGAMLEGIDVQSTDQDWKDVFVKEIQDLTYKLVNLNMLSLYMNLNEDPKQDFISHMQDLSLTQVHELLQKSIRKNQHQYIMRPVNGNLKLTMQKLSRTIDLSKPQFHTDCLFEQIAFQFTNAQYRQFVHLVEYFTNYSQHEPMRRYRPSKRPTEEPRKWWLYATQTIILNNRRSRIMWKKVLERKHDKNEYIGLYKRILEVPWESPLTDEDSERFKSLETKYSTEDLIFFRKLANAEVEEEARRHKDMLKAMKKKKGWFGWKLDDKTKQELQAMKSAGFEKLTDEQKMELYQSVGFSGEETAGNNASITKKEFVKIKMRFHLGKGSVTILDSRTAKDGNTAQNVPTSIAQINFAEVLSDIQIMDASFKCFLAIGDFNVLDKRNTPFSKIVSRGKDHSSTSLVSIFFEKNPPKSKSDYFAAVKMDRIDILLNLKLIQHITGFFLFDDVNFRNLESMAKESMVKVKALAKEELKKALESKKTIDIQLNFFSPSIIVPIDSGREDTQFLLFDLGTLSLNSNIDSQRNTRLHTLKGIQSRDFYDKFNLSMANIQVLVPQCTIHEYLDNTYHCAHNVDNVLEKVSFEVEINQSVVPDNAELDRFSITSHLPPVKFNVSPQKLSVFTTVLNEIIEFVDNPTGDSEFDIKTSGYINIRGPFNKGWQKCWIEVRMTRCMSIYDSHLRTRRLAMIKLNDHVKFKRSPKNERVFIMELPQFDGSTTAFLFGVETVQERTQWLNMLSEILYSFGTNFFVGNIASLIVKDLKKEWKEQEQGKGVLRASSIGQVLLSSNVVLKQLTIAIQQQLKQPQGDSDSETLQKDLVHIVFDNLTTCLHQRLSDTVLDMQLHRLAMHDMIVSSHDRERTVLSSDKEEAGSIKLTRAVWPSPMVSEEAVVLVESHLHNVKIISEPELASRLVDFGFDMRNLFDNIERKRNIYSANPKISKHEMQAENSRSNAVDTNLGNVQHFLFKLAFQLGSVDITLKNDNVRFATVTMTGSEFNLMANRNALVLQGDSGTFQCQNYSISNSIYKYILSLKESGSNSLLRFEFKQNLRPNFDTVEYNKWVKVRVSAIKYVHIQQFITILQRFVQGPMNVALIRECRRLANQSTSGNARKNAAVEEHQTSTLLDDTINYSVNSRLICWNVDVITPTIVLPCGFHRPDHYIADLGRITMCSRTISHRRPSEGNEKPILSDPRRDIVHTEVYDIHWHSIYLSSVQFHHHHQEQDNNERVQEQSKVSHLKVLDNVDVRVKLSNALIDPYRTIPKHSIGIDVSDIRVSLSKMQYQLVFDFLNANILEGLVDAKGQTSTQFYKTLTNFSSERYTLLRQRDNEKISIPSPGLDEFGLERQRHEEDEPHLHIKVSLNVPSMHMSLLKDRSIADETIEQDLSIATLDMRFLTLSNHVMSNSDVKVHARLSSVVGTDARQDSRNAFKQVLRVRNPLTDKHDGDDAFVQVTFHKDIDGDARLSIASADPVIIFVPDVIMDVVDFFANINYRTIITESAQSSHPQGSVPSDSPRDGSELSHVERVAQDDLPLLSENGIALSDRNVSSSSSPPTVEADFHDNERSAKRRDDITSFSIDMQFGKPVLFIPEDAQDPNCSHLVLEFDVSMDFVWKRDGNENGTLNVTGMRAFIEGANVLAQNRSDTSHSSEAHQNQPIGSLIIEPLTVRFKLQKICSSEEPCPKRTFEMDVQEGGQIRISYSDIKFLVGIIHQFQQHQSMAALQQIDPRLLSAFADRGKVIKEVLEETNVFSKRFHLDCQLVSQDLFCVLIVDDIIGTDIPLFEFVGTKVVSQILVRQQQHVTVSAFLHFNMGANYYNFRIAEWEPIIEHTSSPIKLLAERLPVSYKNSRQRRIETDHMFTIDILSEGMIDFNLSHSMIQTTLKTYHLWMEGLRADRRHTVSQRFEPYSITNETGMLAYFYRDEDDITENNTHMKELQQNRSMRFSFSADDRTGKEDSSQKHYIYVVVGNTAPKKILVNKVKKWYFDFSQESADSFDTMSKGPMSKYLRPVRRTFCVDIQLKEGCKCITVHSGVVLRNTSSVPWEIGCFMDATQRQEREHALTCADAQNESSTQRNTSPIEVRPLCRLQPGQSTHVPCHFAYGGVLALRPATEPHYRWSSPRLSNSFSNLVQTYGKRLISCKHLKNNNERFYCVLNAVKQHAQTVNFVVDVVLDIMPPLSLENLLGCDLECMLFRQSANSKSFTGIFHDTLKCGERRPLYTISLDSTLWMSAKMLGWENSQFSRIYDREIGSELDTHMTNTDAQGQPLPLKIDYSNTGQAFHEVIIFCSYWIINLTEKPIKVIVQGKEAPGQTQDPSSQLLVESSFSAPRGILHQSSDRDFGNNGAESQRRRVSIATEQRPHASAHRPVLTARDPLMFDYYNPNLVFSNTMTLDIGSRFSSKALSMDNVGTSTVIEMRDPNRRYMLGMFVEPGPEPFQRTKFVYISPHLVIVNRTERMLHCKQDSHSIVQEIQVGNMRQYYWPGNSANPMVCIRLEGTTWSTPFKPNVIGEVPLVLTEKGDDSSEANHSNSSNEENPIEGKRQLSIDLFVMVQVHQEKGVVFVFVDQVDSPPYYLHNDTSDIALQVSQIDTDKWINLPPRTKVPFSWHNIYGENKLFVMVENSKQHCSVVEANVVSSERKHATPTAGKHIYSKVTAYGMTRTIHFTEVRLNSSGEISENHQRHALRISAKIRGIGISVIDHTPNELMYITLQGFQSDLSLTQTYLFFEFALKRLQMDNQLPNAIFPVALSNAIKLEGRDFVHMSCVYNFHEKSYHYFPYLSVLVQEADLMLDIGFVSQIANFISTLVTMGTTSSASSSSKRRNGKREVEEDHVIMPCDLALPNVPGAAEQKRIYFESLVLHPIKSNFSFIFSGASGNHSHNTPNIANGSISGENIPVINVIQTIGKRLNANIDEVPIKLNALILQHPFMPAGSLLESIAQHYAKRSTQEMYKLVGSMDFIGNPIGLVNDLDAAVFDLFYEPIDAISRSPKDFAKGLARGSLGFLKHSIHGTFNTASKVTESVGHGLSYLTLDSEYINAQQANRLQRKARHAGEGVLFGLRALSGGVMEGASGIVTKPIQGASMGGVMGFFSGIGKGLVGAPIKPVSGMLAAVSHAAEGIRNTTKFFEQDGKRRTRLPRVIGIDDTLRPFNAEHAIGQQKLSQVLEQMKQQYRREKSSADASKTSTSDIRQHTDMHHVERYISHTVITGDVMVLVTTAHLIVLNSQSNSSINNDCNIQWTQPHRDFVSVRRIHHEATAFHGSSGEIILKISAECQQRQRETSWFGRASVTERRITSHVPEDQESLDRLFSVLYGMINQRDQERILDDSIR